MRERIIRDRIMRVGLTITFLALWGSAAIGVLLLHPDHGGSNSELALIVLGTVWFVGFLVFGGIEIAAQFKERRRRKGLIYFPSEYWGVYRTEDGLIHFDLSVDIHTERTSFKCALRVLVDGVVTEIKEPHIDHRIQDIRCYVQADTIQPHPVSKSAAIHMTVSLDTGLSNESGPREIAITAR